MPVFESESLVLRSYNLSEADRIIVFFTREHGIIRGVAKGAKRLKSRFGSTLEQFSTVNLTWFQKEDRELVSIQNVDLAESRFSAAADIEFLQTYSYLANLLMAMLPPHDPNETTYRMTKACLNVDIGGREALAAVRLYFELWLLRLGGYLPDWSRCSECRCHLTIELPVGLQNDMRLLCEGCRGARRMPAVTRLQREMFQGVQSTPPAVFVGKAKLHPQTVAELSEMLRRIVTSVLGPDAVSDRALPLTS